MIKIFFFISLIIFLLSCGDAAKVLRNEKIKTTDEFLVKKKEPLVLPPDYNEIPEPGSISDKKKLNDREKLKKIIDNTKVKSDKINNNDSSSIEQKIIDKISK